MHSPMPIFSSNHQYVYVPMRRSCVIDSYWFMSPMHAVLVVS